MYTAQQMSEISVFVNEIERLESERLHVDGTSLRDCLKRARLYRAECETHIRLNLVIRQSSDAHPELLRRLNMAEQSIVDIETMILKYGIDHICDDEE